MERAANREVIAVSEAYMSKVSKNRIMAVRESAPKAILQDLTQ
jgi:uncharacterized protein YegP (UPF0339 family)